MNTNMELDTNRAGADSRLKEHRTHCSAPNYLSCSPTPLLTLWVPREETGCCLNILHLFWAGKLRHGLWAEQVTPLRVGTLQLAGPNALFLTPRHHSVPDMLDECSLFALTFN